MLNVELVNDSDRSDDEVFLLLTGTAVTVTGGIATLQLPQAKTGSVTAGALGSMTASGTLVSTQTGQTCTSTRSRSAPSPRAGCWCPSTARWFMPPMPLPPPAARPCAGTSWSSAIPAAAPT